jgi:hypothetical protein
MVSYRLSGVSGKCKQEREEIIYLLYLVAHNEQAKCYYGVLGNRRVVGNIMELRETVIFYTKCQN